MSSLLSVLFILGCDLVLALVFWTLERQLKERFYRRCALAFCLEFLATVFLLLLGDSENRSLIFILIFGFITTKGFVLWSAVKSLDSSKSYKWLFPIVFCSFCLLAMSLGFLGVNQDFLLQIVVLITFVGGLTPAWAIFHTQYISKKTYQFFFACVLFSQVLFLTACEASIFNLLTDDSVGVIYYFGMITNVFTGLVALLIGMKRLQGKLATAMSTITSMRNQTETIVKASVDSILVTDTSGVIQFANPAACHLFIQKGVENQNLFDINFLEHSGAISSMTLKDILQRLSDDQDAFARWQCSILHDALGNIPIEVTVLPNQNDHDLLLVFYIRDLRQQRQFELDIIQARDRAEKINEELAFALEKAKNANEAKNQFLAVMSHELRTPLCAIIGMAKLTNDEKLSASQHQNLTTITESGQGLLKIIGDILDYSTIESGIIECRTEAFELRRCMRQVLEVVREQCCGHSVRIMPFIDPELPTYFLGDDGKLRQIMINLISNAIKFTGHGHISLHISGSMHHGTESWLVEMVIKDNGIGIDEANQAKLFTPFYQADYSSSRRYSGSGLGLAICKKLVEAMGGKIRLKSAENEGTTCFVSVPLSVDRSQPQSNSLQSFNGRFRYVDSDEIARRWMRRTLDAYGIEGECLDSIGMLLEDTSTIQGGSELWVIDQGAFTSIDARDRLVAHAGQRGNLTSLVCVFDQASSFLNAFDSSLSKPFMLEQIWDLSDLSFLASKMRRKQEDAAVHHGPLGLKVLVVDDNRVNLNLTKIYMRRLGCDFCLAQSGEQALKFAQNQYFDVVLMDIHMPGMDGVETSRHLTQIYRGSRVPWIVALTAGLSEEHYTALSEMGITDHLTKPFTLGTMLSFLLKAPRC
jgi:signal transduction histidine kinase